MAILWHDGFDAAPTTLGSYLSRLGYSGTTTATCQTGRLGTGNAIFNTQPIFILASALTTFIAGIGFKTTSVASGHTIMIFNDGSGAQLTLRVSTTGAVELRLGAAGGTLIQTTSAGLVLDGVWSYYEVKATISDASGVYSVHKDGVEILSGSGVDTKAQSTTTITTITLTNTGTSIDDFYVADTTGSSPWNDFLGPVSSLAKMPDAEGTTIDWTPSTGTDNSATIDDAPANDDTDYNSAASAALLDLLGHGNIGGTDTVICVTQRVLARKTDAGVASLKLVARTNSSNFEGSTQAIPDSYAYLSRIYQVNPDTTGQWSASEVNAAEFGYKSA